MSDITNVQQRPDLTDVELARDVEPLLMTEISKLPITSMIMFDNANSAFNHKHEWFDDHITQNTSTLTADISAHAASATGLTITVASSAFFKVGDTVFVNELAPAYRVTAIPNGTTLTVDEIRGVALASGAGNGKTIRFTRGALEKSVYTDFRGARAGTQEYNYTQIFRENVEVSWHLQAASRRNGIYTIDDLWENAIQNQMRQIAWEFYQAATIGVRQNRAANSDIGMMGGLREFLDPVAGGGNVVTASGQISMDYINEVVEMIFEDVTDLNGLIIVVPTGISKQISQFDANNIRYNNPGPNNVRGLNVSTIIPDISGSPGLPLLIDQNMPTNEVWFLRPENIRITPFDVFTMRVYEQPTQGTTARQGFIYGEYTQVVRNGKTSMGMIKNLTT